MYRIVNEILPRNVPIIHSVDLRDSHVRTCTMIDAAVFNIRRGLTCDNPEIQMGIVLLTKIHI
jgi:hypothetical protein